MERRRSSYTGCLLGLAAGDALGQGQSLVNGFLPTTAYTQLAAYGCNGLLLGLTRGQLSGTMAPPVRYVALALGDWADRQLWRGESPVRCWISRSPRLDYRRCPEPELMDVLQSGALGTMEDHPTALSGPGALMAAVAVGLFFDPERLPRREIQRLGAETAALTHGDPAAFLSGAAVAHLVSRMVWDGAQDPEKLVRETGAMLRRRFGREYRQAYQVAELLRSARKLAKVKELSREEALEKLGCDCASRVLAGAVYCLLTCGGEPEGTMEDAARWSGAGAAVTGALLGARYGEEAIPGWWRDALECGSVLRELAEDLYRGCPMMKGSRIFDIEWDEKYNTADL